ncbi:Uma2 family endonuclease [Clostridium beijerinckii]|uniref:Uma2 family endonuclease n=1 Tax=Clostridium beijerinckii TaxID=1520 RepID=UPI00041A22B1|nr:Uma2 family endonuclease [Clostridium beijerinckii]MZK50654.1 Uma2 family endonuclease [Clostridium beijerinckii]MZK58858.1 Uma2 family endonuclease [Clostridium beijerinckii]MZK68977.1 Uma2 family endonuclease [Clostridium beijerinckii]MZK74349.1 Uma2 family endonuclease [Clostridium beijerinckii]MZK84049.1 Uma2 family endonuclease [Clostridium beijerinckii]
MQVQNNIFISLDEFDKIQANYDGKAEYYNGQILFSSRTSMAHNRIVMGISSALYNFFKGSKCTPYSEQIEVIFKNESEVYKFLPDIFVMCEDADKKGESFISAPQIIFEVVSPEYSEHDYFIKANIYQRFGVLEYNIVEQNGMITQYSLVDRAYRTPKVLNHKDLYVSSVFPELKFELKDIFE